MAFYELSPEALDDVQFIHDFIALDGVQAAERSIDQFFEHSGSSLRGLRPDLTD